MRRVLLGFWSISLLFIAASGTASPLKGKRSLDVQKIPERTRITFEERFRGGERACVIVRGDHDPVVNLGVFVYDEQGTLVAEDQGGGDFVTAIWYPPRDALYRIEILNPGAAWNACYISLK